MRQLSRSEPGPTTGTQSSVYQPLDFVMVRTPLLPFDLYRALSHGVLYDPEFYQPGTLLPRDPRIHSALAIGSQPLLEALSSATLESREAPRLQGKLLRFLIRMATRPTPYGLFAGVALGRWGDETDLSLAREQPRTRTRPDMEWLFSLILPLEAQPEVRRHLLLMANPAAVQRADRIMLAEPVVGGPVGQTAAVSVRATGAVLRALELARMPIVYADLLNTLLESTPGATPEKVDYLLDELCRQTILLTDLRPPLTCLDPAGYVVERLRHIPAARPALDGLERVLSLASEFDRCSLQSGGAGVYQKLLSEAKAQTVAAQDTPVQVDMALSLGGGAINRQVALEAAHAAELVLRLSPLPVGLPHLAAYRQSFIARYGMDREVPLLELLDPTTGLGPPQNYGTAASIPQARAAMRARTLLALAHGAMNDRRHAVELDEQTLSRLETWQPSASGAPPSLDLYILVAAPSPQAIDAGEFELIVGPNVGAMAAGRNLGRFSDVIGAEAVDALHRAARAEEEDRPHAAWAELVYLPQRVRGANVAIRPPIRRYEITLGVSSGVEPDRLIPLNELVVGLRSDGFYVRWPEGGTDVVACSGHMLNFMAAPAPFRFLADVAHQNVAYINTFDWGPATGFPFLPRVQVGRIILHPAEWHIDTWTRSTELPCDSPSQFLEALGRWRERWRLPRHIYLTFADNRLLLDLDDPLQAAELYAELRTLQEGGQLVLQEVLPQLDEMWVEGPEGRYASELVVSFVRREHPGQAVQAATPLQAEAAPVTRPLISMEVPRDRRLRPPGTEWLFAKLYAPRTQEDDLLSGPMADFAEEVVAAGLADSWFFVRYADPDTHLRLRFRGNSESLRDGLLPSLFSWVADLMAEDRCQRFALDTYDREIERYGGLAGLELAEAIFAADSRAVVQLLQLTQSATWLLDRTTLAILSVDDLIAGLGWSPPERMEWYAGVPGARDSAGEEYRRRKGTLRRLLQDGVALQDESAGPEVAAIFRQRRESLEPLGRRQRLLAETGELTQSPGVLLSSYIHLHCNRLLGSDAGAETRILGLLARTWEGLLRGKQRR